MSARDLTASPPPPPSPSFSTLLGQGHTPKLKSFILSRHHHQQECPPSPPSPSEGLGRQMPPLEPLLDPPHSRRCSSPTGYLHPKKRSRHWSNSDGVSNSINTSHNTPFSSSLTLPLTSSLNPSLTQSLTSPTSHSISSPTSVVTGLQPLSPPSTHLPHGYSLSQVFSDLPCCPSPSSSSSPSSSLGGGAPENITTSASPTSPNGDPRSLQPSGHIPDTPYRRKDNDDCKGEKTSDLNTFRTDLENVPRHQHCALDLSHLVKSDNLPELVVAEPQQNSQPTTNHIGPLPHPPTTSRSEVVDTSAGSHQQLALHPQSPFQSVNHQRSPFQPVSQQKRSFQPVRPLRHPYPPHRRPFPAGTNSIFQYPPGPYQPQSPSQFPPGPHQPQSPSYYPPGPYQPQSPSQYPPGTHQPQSPRQYPPGTHQPQSPSHYPPGTHQPQSPIEPPRSPQQPPQSPSQYSRHLLGSYHRLPPPPPLNPITGNQTRQMPSEMVPYARQTFPRDVPEPSARNKQIPWLSPDRIQASSPSRLTNIGSQSAFEKTKLQEQTILEWTYDDVVSFIFAAYEDLNLGSNSFDVNFAVLSGSTGRDLLAMDLEGFKDFSKGNGEQLYWYFQEQKMKEDKREEDRRMEERKRQEDARRQDQDRRQAIVSSQQILYKNNHLFSPPLEYGTTGHHQSVLMETSAPYEIHYEEQKTDARARVGISDNPPSAAHKTLQFFTSPPNPYPGNEMFSDQDQSEEERKPEVPKKRGPGRPRKPENELKKKRKKTGRLWEFIRNLLLDPETCPSMVRWENAEEGIFRFVQAEKVAQRWGDRKQNKDMNYEKLSRAMRYYYKGGVFEAVLGRRLVYKFGKNAKNWRPSNPNFVNPPQ